MSQYGENMTHNIVSGLAKKYNIVANLTEGINKVAINEALENKAKTVAFLNYGIDYEDKENQNIIDEIKKTGLILSEIPNKEGFEVGIPIMHSRIVAGSSRLLLVPEAEKHSSSLIAVTHALSMGRDVSCVPNRADTNSACNELIKQGANLVENSRDIDDECVQTKILKTPEKKNDEKKNLDKKASNEITEDISKKEKEAINKKNEALETKKKMDNIQNNEVKEAQKDLNKKLINHEIDDVEAGVAAAEIQLASDNIKMINSSAEAKIKETSLFGRTKFQEGKFTTGETFSLLTSKQFSKSSCVLIVDQKNKNNEEQKYIALMNKETKDIKSSFISKNVSEEVLDKFENKIKHDCIAKFKAIEKKRLETEKTVDKSKGRQ